MDKNTCKGEGQVKTQRRWQHKEAEDEGILPEAKGVWAYQSLVDTRKAPSPHGSGRSLGSDIWPPKLKKECISVVLNHWGNLIWQPLEMNTNPKEEKDGNCMGHDIPLSSIRTELHMSLVNSEQYLVETNFISSYHSREIWFILLLLYITQSTWKIQCYWWTVLLNLACSDRLP